MTENPLKRGLLRSFLWLSVIVWMVAAFIAVGVAASRTSYPAVAGWVVLAALMGLAAIAAERWVSVLPGMLGVAAMNALYSTLSGYFGMNPPKPIARPSAAAMMIALMVGAVVSTGYMNRKLTNIDRLSLTCAIVSLLVGLSQGQLAVPATIGIALFLAAGLGYRNMTFKRGNSPGRR